MKQMTATVDVKRDLSAEMTITVRLTGAWRLRLGLWLIKLGAHVIGWKIKVEDVEKSVSDAAERIFSHAIDWNEGRKKWDKGHVENIIKHDLGLAE